MNALLNMTLVLALSGVVQEPPFTAEFAKIKADMDKLSQESNKGYADAKTEEEREALQEKVYEANRRQGGPLVEKALTLVTPHAKDPAAVEVLVWVLNHHSLSGPATGDRAAELLREHHLTDPKTLEIASRYTHAPVRWNEKLLRALAAADLPKDKKPQSKFMLAQYLASKASIPPILKSLDGPMLKRVEAFYGKEYLAELSAADASAIEAEAIRLYNEVVEKYPDEKNGSKTFGERAKAAVYEIQNLGIGKPAPEIAGEDIDGKPMKLSDYRGKVIMLDFWGHW